MFEPVKVDASATPVEADRITAFVVTKDDKDTEYTIPTQISGATALLALEVYVNRGETATVLWLARHALGAEGMTAVLESEQLTILQTRALVQRIGEHYLGQVKELGKASDGD
jgi:hypothetical protein